MIDDRYDRLNTKDKEEFTRILNRLLRVNYINREVYSAKDNEMRSNYDYRFIDRQFLLYEDYLLLGGWSLNKDDRFGVIYIQSQYEYNKKRMNKFSTLILLTLRLIYDEEREKLTLKREVSLTVHELVQKMLALGIINKKPAYNDLHSALSEMAAYHIVDRMDGTWKEADTRFLIYPTILFILSNARLNELAELIEEGEVDQSEDGDQEEMAWEDEADEDL
ncbi:DUF4194 domain-containing protein [Petrocella sp. FN5]|uniref:DUF4194 domain-containing protein n=1 Tax=Petrocella sp. FN5 TaxID=3032002 RepID=UPI0023DBCAD4|nr:DUF4194 domain-containing protein [Petrocella sp. FN5]MDF1617614.1 DUF4194 domain-containing protein [Petrocella sp. FN5]